MEVESFEVVAAHQRCVRAMAFSPMDDSFISISLSASESTFDDRSIAFWHKKSRYEKFDVCQDESSRFNSSVAFSLDGTHVAFASMLELREEDDLGVTWIESRIRICNVERHRFQQVAAISDMNFVLCLCFLHNNDCLAYGCDDGSVNVFRKTLVKTKKSEKAVFVRCQTMRRHRRGVLAIAFCPEARLLVSTSHDATVSVWRLLKDDEMRFKAAKLLVQHEKSVCGVAFSATKKCFATVAYDGQFCVWSVTTLDCIACLKLPLILQCVAAFPGIDTFVVGARDGTLLFWNRDWPSPKKLFVKKAAKAEEEKEEEEEKGEEQRESSDENDDNFRYPVKKLKEVGVNTKRSIECVAVLNRHDSETDRTTLAFGSRDGCIRVFTMRVTDDNSNENKNCRKE